MAQLTDEQIAKLLAAFEISDRNGDGYIDGEEFHALLRRLDDDVSKEEALLNFESVDTEGDGYIGFKEFMVWWTN
jgi:calcium-binding protein CML